MADAYPHRNVKTGLVQMLTEDQAAVFPGAYERLADDYEAVQAAAEEAHATLEAVQDGGTKAEVKDAKAEAKAADEAAAAVVVTPAPTPEES